EPSTKPYDRVVGRDGFNVGRDAERGETIDEVPVLVTGDGAGDEEIAPVPDIGEQSLPGGFAERLRGRKNDEFGGAELVDLVFGDDVARLVQVVTQSADSFPLSLQLEFIHHGKLFGLRRDDSDGGQYRILQIRRSSRGKFRKVAQHGGLRLFRGVCVQSAD